MKYIELIEKLPSPVFTLQDLKLAGIKIYPYQLSNWSSKGYILKLKNGVYILNREMDKVPGRHIAFSLNPKSYLSMEWALFKYGLIPEIVNAYTSITTKPGRTYNNKMGTFIYRSVKKDLFFGYYKEKENGFPYLIAYPEKALVDFLYLNSGILDTKEDVEELRLNQVELKNLNKNKINEYAKATNLKKMSKILKLIFE